jgi:hypothetical protein
MGIVPQPRPAPSEAEKFEAALRRSLYISSFPKPTADQIYKTCLRTEPVAYVVTRTVWSTDIGRWLAEAEPFSGAAIVLTLVGFLGSFAQRATRLIYGMTFGRIAAWIRNG